MFFQWGIEKEAEIYLNASVMGLLAQQSYVDSFVSDTSLNMRQMNLDSFSYTGIVELIAKWTEQAIRENGWGVCDEDGVAWFIALYSKSYIASTSLSYVDYNTLFKDCFIKYFENK